MDFFLSDIWAIDIYRKLILTVFILLLYVILRSSIHRLILPRIPDDSPYLVTVRKLTGYLLNILTVLLIFAVWIQKLGDLTVALGLLAAGLAFALQEIIGSIAGWTTIISGQPFVIGDRIETGGIRGDVVDVSLLRTKLMEIGNWMGGDHNTGRIVTVSNAYIFKEPLFNYSRHINYIWDEITIPVTYESDWRKAIAIMSEAVRERPSYLELLPKAQEQRRQARREFAIKITSLEPRVFVRLTDNWIELGLIYPVYTETRRSFRSDVSQQILTDFSKAGITIASQTVAVVKFPDAGAISTTQDMNTF
jgi:small-conductance mechanosensitive channel